jgi:hypothetical protein
MALKSSQVVTSVPVSVEVKDTELNEKLPNCNQKSCRTKRKLKEFKSVFWTRMELALLILPTGTLGGLKKAFPMQNNALVLGFSCTKAIAATMAHVMVEEGLS